MNQLYKRNKTERFLKITGRIAIFQEINVLQILKTLIGAKNVIAIIEIK